MRGRRLAALLMLAVAAAGLLLIARPYVNGLSFVIRAADMRGAIRTLADAGTRRTIERQIDIDVPMAAHGKIRGRLYAPDRRPSRMVLLVSGLHPAGIEEPRLMAFARLLAASGFAVVTPDIPELSRFEIAPAITSEIEAAALWLSELSTKPGATGGDGRIGLIGISFSGGLSVVAAGRATLRDRIAFVLSLGGHDDLPRVVRYLCLGTEARPPHQLRLTLDATKDVADPLFVRPPHDYAVAMMLMGVAERVAPLRQVTALRDGVRRFLLASALDRVDRARATQEFAALRTFASTLPGPSATLLRNMNDRDVVHLGARLLPYVHVDAGAPQLSPSRSPKPTAPVFLLHGVDDNMIPAVESEYLADEIRGHGLVRLLVTDSITNADVGRSPRVGDALRLAGFWGDLLAQ
jgi:pimeloyl-ACP methyl ester carboxylesterase